VSKAPLYSIKLMFKKVFGLYVTAYLNNMLVFCAVPPAYYAHLAAFRARFYMEPDTSDSGSVVSGVMTSGPTGPRRAAAAAGSVAVKPLPDLKENVKRVMFYC
jgi:hypothetical protein